MEKQLQQGTTTLACPSLTLVLTTERALKGRCGLPGVGEVLGPALIAQSRSAGFCSSHGSPLPAGWLWTSNTKQPAQQPPAPTFRRQPQLHPRQQQEAATVCGGELPQESSAANVCRHQLHLNVWRSRQQHHHPRSQQLSHVPHHAGAGLHLSEPCQQPLHHASLVVQAWWLTPNPKLTPLLALWLVLVASYRPASGKPTVAAGLMDLLGRWPQACSSPCKLPTIRFSGNIESLLACNNVSTYSPHQDPRSNWMGPHLERREFDSEQWSQLTWSL